MNNILCSTGAIIGWSNRRDFTLLEQITPRLSCDGYEFMMYGTWYDQLDPLRRFMDGFSAPIPVFHCDKEVGDRISRNEPGDLDWAMEHYAVNCTLAREFGARKLVLHLWGGLASDRDADFNYAQYPPLRRMAEENDLLLTVENVVCNHSTPMDHLLALTRRYPDISFTFDTKMAHFHRQLERLYTNEALPLLPRIAHFHLNDYGGGYKEWANLRTLHPGRGSADFPGFFAWLRKAGYTGDFTVEATSFGEDGRVDFAALNHSFSLIRSQLA